MMTIEDNKNGIYQAVKKACEKANRSSEEVNIIAVTKYVSSEIAEELVETGIKHIAENRVDKFLDKYQALKKYDLTWHLIGSLQRRKVKDVINLVDYFHALDSVKLAEEIQKRADHTINCFLQVNVSGEESKHGFPPEELDTVLNHIANLDKICIVGLMTMAPIDANAQELDKIFAETNELRQSIQDKKIKNVPCDQLSMGMSRDYDMAIQNDLMAIKDAIDKIVSYFDTDEVTDYEDVAKEEAKERPVKVQKTGHTPPRQQRKPERPQATVPPRRQHINSDVQETQVLRSLPLSRSQANQGSQQMNITKTTIAIKYPKKYEDAQNF